MTSRHTIQSLALTLIGALALAGCPAETSGGNTTDAGSDPQEEGTAGRKPPKPRPGGGHAGSGAEPQDGGVSLPDDPEDPSDPGDPSDPNEPSDPQHPVEPHDPEHPDDPNEPSDPNDPDEPADPDPGGDSRFFLPTGEPENTRAPKVVLDAEGGVHTVYPAYAGGGAFYAYCAGQCDPASMQVAYFPTEGTVNNAMIAVTSTGKPRVLLSTSQRVYYAECDGNCTDSSEWNSSVILEHEGKRDITGNAFTLDAQDRPRFAMHTYLALLGIGQTTPATYLARCDSGCFSGANWSFDPIADQIWMHSQLRFDDDDRAHLATVVVIFENGVPTAKKSAYLVCTDGDCSTNVSWNGIILADAYERPTAEIAPTIAMALTADGGPRIATVAKGEGEGKLLLYFECDQACDENNWRYITLSSADQIGAGVDIALDAQAHPRVAFTLNSNIGIYHCDTTGCANDGATWDLGKVEWAADLPKDDIIIWPDCTVDGWFLHDPSIALDRAGKARVGYEATDISGGGTGHTDPSKPHCGAGKDMTLARMAFVPGTGE